MAEYFIFLSTGMGLTFSLIGIWLWIERQRSPKGL